ncbi:alginate export family protein [Lutibacter sp. A80]|uniref:alginate export family protein n=1 Tax=Lutibacter sp. A80 TaxID=2918453 RepID=UPI001F05716A|nr:alginate export family protein [Lutibacter sp. A80]UMB59581.1 alginate export family protein [Lutibacter sp. A80]
MNLRYTFVIILSFIVSQTFAQFTLSGELRPRTEFRNGYKTLNFENADAAFATSQRTRLNFNYATEFYSFYVSLQDVRVWGDVSQLNVSDKNGLAIHQAWGLVNFKEMKLKAGRQEIVYDDHRIFGNVGWATQARSHDALVLKFGKTFNLDIGLAFNQDYEKLSGTIYTTSNNYKALQYAWFHKTLNNFSTSFLFLNNGLQYIDIIDSENSETRYSQTIGTHLKYKFSDALNASSNIYYQFGKDVFSKDLDAYLIGMNLGYKVSENWNLGLGFEVQSGNAYNDDLSTNHAFTPFYGTNHKFNGFMDYFYVGNHMNSTGLIDVFASASTKIGEKSNLSLYLHNFTSHAKIAENIDKQLGTEIDIVYNYKYTKDVTIGAGYSQMFASEGMEVLKNVPNPSNANNWAWVMLTINPTLFTSK